jgi:hypothetical protein
MLDITKQAAARPQEIAALRMTMTRYKAPPELADKLLTMVTPETADEIAPDVADGFRRLKAGFQKYLTGVTDAVDAAMQEMADILDNPETDPADLPKAISARLIEMARHHAGDDGRLHIGPHVRNSWDEGPGLRQKLTMALTKRLDPATAAKSGYTGEALTVADIAMTCARRAGLRPFNDAEAVRMAAHSTSDFPLILDGTMGNLVARDIALLQPAIRRAAHEVGRDDYRQGRSLRLSATSQPTEIREGGEIKFVTADEKGELLPKLRDYGSGFNLTNQALVNDSTATGLINQMARKMAEGAVGAYRAVLVEPLLANSGGGQTMADGKNLFHADHGNLAAAPAALNVTSLSVARTAMRRQRGLRGEILSIEPWALIVPPEQETNAQQLVAVLAAQQVSNVNPFTNALEVIVEPGLTSLTAWYVCADPGRFDGLAVGFLNGQSAPRIESRPAWNTLGMEMRLVWALDAKFVEHATWYRNAGA